MLCIVHRIVIRIHRFREKKHTLPLTCFSASCQCAPYGLRRGVLCFFLFSFFCYQNKVAAYGMYRSTQLRCNVHKLLLRTVPCSASRLYVLGEYNLQGPTGGQCSSLSSFRSSMRRSCFSPGAQLTAC